MDIYNINVHNWRERFNKELGFGDKHDSFCYGIPENIQIMTNSIFFNLICCEGTPKIVESYLKLHNVDEYDIGTGFDNSCMFNLDNAKYLYKNYKATCQKYIYSTCANYMYSLDDKWSFATAFVNNNKLDTLLWLKSLYLPQFNFQIDYLIMVVACKNNEGDLYKFLYEHFYDRFKYLQNN